MRSRQVSLKRVLLSPDSTVTLLTAVYADEFGFEALNWHPAAAILEAEQAAGAPLNQRQADRLLCGLSLLTSDAFYVSLPDFVFLANVLGGHPPPPGVFDVADAEECALAIAEAALLSPPEDAAAPFAPEIVDYVAYVLRQEGLLHPPAVLDRVTGGIGQLGQSLHDWADDPVMYSAAASSQKERADAISTAAVGRVRDVVRQLEAFPFRSGDAAGLSSRLGQAAGS
jgi:hypothetical protein